MLIGVIRRRYQDQASMEAALFIVFFSILFAYVTYNIFRPSGHRVPPSPVKSLPIIGHIHHLKQPLHRSLCHLSQIRGDPIFSLKLGFRRAVVVSSPDIVEECFTRNDIVLANRPKFLVDKYIGYNHTTMSGAPYGDHWRSLRRIASQELLSVARLNGFVRSRRDEVRHLLSALASKSHRGFSRVVLRPDLSLLTFNVMMRMIAGKRYSGEENWSEDGENFLDLIKHVFELAQTSDPQDFLPFLQWFDYGGFKKQLSDAGARTDAFFQNLVDEHRREKRNTMIGHLLSLQESQPEFYSDQTIKGLILSMLLAGTDTSSVTIEWAMSLLVNHPIALEKARKELDDQVGVDRLMDEDDLPNLPFLRSIVSETYRLFPAAPLLLPHEPYEDCKLGGYDVPRGTTLFINAWAIHRDPKLWDKPTVFNPERFEGKDEVGTSKLLPFGMGRRACPGYGLAQRMVGLTLGSLVHCFEWERTGGEEVELEEGVGLTMPKLNPLEVMCRPRDVMHNVIQKSSPT